MRHRAFPFWIFLASVCIVAGAGFRYRAAAFFARWGAPSGCPAVSIPFPGAADHSVSGAAVSARIFAAYPFSDRNMIYADKGAGVKIRASMPVLTSSGILLGVVSDVAKEYSSIRLVGSPDWQIPVRIGEGKVPGLLTGGPTTHVGMIAAGKRVMPGDAIVAASKELPYGLPIGSVESVYPDSSGGVFQEAVVKFAYVPGDLTDVTIELWTPDF